MEKQRDVKHTIEEVVAEMYPQTVRFCCFCWPKHGIDIAHDSLTKFAQKVTTGQFQYVDDAKMFKFVKVLAQGIARNTYRLKANKKENIKELLAGGYEPMPVPEAEPEIITCTDNIAWRFELGILVLRAGIAAYEAEERAGKKKKAVQIQQTYLFPAVDVDQPRTAKARPKNNINRNAPQQQIMLW